MGETEFAKSWAEWLKTDMAQKCLDGAASGEFLKNRLWYAFSAGYDARKNEVPPPAAGERDK